LIYRQRPIDIRQSTIGNRTTHPLPRRGTDFIPKLHHYPDNSPGLRLRFFVEMIQRIVPVRT